MAKTTKIRAKADTIDTGQLRYRTYKSAIVRIKKSIDEGYYLEAITLCESLIADRLESRLNYIKGTNEFSFKPLGTLQDGIRKIEKDVNILKLINGESDSWRISRNDALHAMAKIEDGDTKEWNDKINDCKVIAERGEEIRKKIFKLI
jgi:hypothetical protein